MSISVESAGRAALGVAGAGVLAGAMFFTALPSAPEASAAPAVVNTAGFTATLPMHTAPIPQHWHHHHWWWHHWWWW